MTTGAPGGTDGDRMASELIDGRDIELILVGAFSFVAALGWLVVSGPTPDLFPLVSFLLLGTLSFALAWWDIQTRGGLSIREGD